MRKIFPLILALALLLGGCAPGEEETTPAPSPAPQVTLPPTTPDLTPSAPVFTLPYDPQGTWDPYTSASSPNLLLLGLTAEGLYRLDRSFDPQPLLAASAQESEDGLTWTLTLRAGVTFSDGEPLGAKAAAAAVRRAMGAGSVYASRLAGVKKVAAAGEDTLIFTLTAPDRRFPALLDFPLVRVTENGVFGTGPYFFEENHLTANPGWWQGETLPRASIPLYPVSGDEALITAFSAGEVSLAATDLTRDGALASAGSCQTWDYPTSTMLYLGYRQDKGFCKNPAFRRALGLALDRSDLVAQALEGHGDPASLPAPPSSKLNDVSLSRSLGYDPLAAGALLDGLGYPLGEDGLRYGGAAPVTLTLIVNTGSSAKVTMARHIARQLEEVGLTVEVKALSRDNFQKALAGKQFDLYLGETRLAGDMDLTPFYTPDSGLCWGEPKNDAAMAAAAAQAKADGDWGSFYPLWAEDPAFAVLCFKTAAVLTPWEGAAGLTPTQGNLFDRFWDWQLP